MVTKQPTHKKSSIDKIQPLLNPVCSTYHSHPPGHLGRPSPKSETLRDQTCGLWQGSWCTPELPYPGGLDPDGTAAQSLKTAVEICTTSIHKSSVTKLNAFNYQHGIRRKVHPDRQCFCLPCSHVTSITCTVYVVCREQCSPSSSSWQHLNYLNAKHIMYSTSCFIFSLIYLQHTLTLFRIAIVFMLGHTDTKYSSSLL